MKGGSANVVTKFSCFGIVCGCWPWVTHGDLNNVWHPKMNPSTKFHVHTTMDKPFDLSLCLVKIHDHQVSWRSDHALMCSRVYFKDLYWPSRDMYQLLITWVVTGTIMPKIGCHRSCSYWALGPKSKTIQKTLQIQYISANIMNPPTEDIGIPYFFHQMFQWNSNLANVLGIPDIFLILFLNSWNFILFYTDSLKMV